MPNVELMNKVLAKIEADPDSWDQDVWGRLKIDAAGHSCGTAFCFAGWATKLSGHSIEFKAMGDGANVMFVDGDGWAGCVEDIAIRELDINEELSATLFSGGRDLDDIRQIVRYANDGLSSTEIDEAFWNSDAPEAIA